MPAPRTKSSVTYAVESRVGRLVEARIEALRNEGEATAYSHLLGSVVATVPATRRAILCADHRQVKIYGKPVSDRLAELFALMNTRLECVAIVVAPSNAILAMQLTRIAREAGLESRRVFVDATEAKAFLDEALDAAERYRLGVFLGLTD